MGSTARIEENAAQIMAGILSGPLAGGFIRQDVAGIGSVKIEGPALVEISIGLARQLAEKVDRGKE